MPVIGGANPTVNVTLPVPAPAPMAKKPKAPAPAQPAPQPVPTNPDSGQQPAPQGLVPQQQVMPAPTPTSIIFPWTPADQPKKKLPRKSLRMAKRKYARDLPDAIKKMEQALGENPGHEAIRHSLADLHEEAGNHERANALRSAPNSIEVHGRRWFRRGPGNTYHTAQIVVNGQDVPGVPMEYGYGDHFLDTAADQLEKLGYMPDRKKHSNGSKESIRWWAQRHGVKFDYSVRDVPRQRDLHQFSRPKKYAAGDDLSMKCYYCGSSNTHGARTDGTANAACADCGKLFSYDHETGESSPRSERKRYSADDLSMDFDSMGEDELPRQPLQRPIAEEDITGRKRKQILQQMLEAAKKGHYSDMTPTEMVQDLETPPDVPQGGGQVWLSDPEDEEPEKFTRLVYPKKMSRSDEAGLTKTIADNPNDFTPKSMYADWLEEQGRQEESNLLRSGKPHVIEKHGEGFRVRSGRLTGRYIEKAGDRLRRFLNENHPNWNDDALGERLAYLDPRNRHDQIRLTEHFRPEDFHDPEHWQSPVPEGHLRAIHIDPNGVNLHSAEDVPFHELGNHYADQIDEEVNNAGYDENMFQNEHEYERLLDAVRKAPYFD